MDWRPYTGFPENNDPTEGALPSSRKRQQKKKQQDQRQSTAANEQPQPAKGPSGKQKLKKTGLTLAPMPFQKVDWPTRSQYLKRLTQLRIERTSWIQHWEDLSWHVLPRQARFTSTDKNLGYRKDKLIINSRATKDLRTMAAGMMSGISSPARPWFKLTTRDPDMAKSGRVKEWLQVCEDRVRSTFAKSNFYNALHTMYTHLGLYGTSAAVIEEDFKDTIRLYVQPIGAYMLAQSGDCRVDTLYREISLTIGQLVSKFSPLDRNGQPTLENVSNWVAWNYAKGNYDLWTYIVHVIEPNRQVDNVRWQSKFSPFRSAWFELGAFSGSYGYDTSDSGYTGEPLNFLMESGFKEFPVIAPRWQTAGMEDVYGEAPAMDCLGDIRSLQALERAKSKLVAKLADPPMKGPASMRNGRPSIMAGDFTAVDDSASGQKFEPAQVVDPRGLEALREDIKAHVERIDASLFVDVLQMFQGSVEDPSKTATEIAALKEEKLQLLGPTLERVHGEMLEPAINRTFNILMRSGKIPIPPPELQGVDLDIVYISTAAQAQRAIGVQAMQSVVSFVKTLSELRPEAVDNIDPDAMSREYADLVGAKPSLLVPADKLAQLRAQRQQQQAKQQQLAQAEQLSKTAKNMGGADTSQDNLLGQYLQGLGQQPPGQGQAA